MGLVVQKYGGSSVSDAERIKRVAERIVATRKAGHDVCVVVSAMGDATDDLIELARQAGISGKAPECINSGRYLSMATGLAAATSVSGTPTVRINGEDYTPTTPDALVAKIKEIVG